MSVAGAVDGDPVPVPHFGMALSVEQFHELAERIQSAGISFILQPHLRFKGARICTCAWCMFESSDNIMDDTTRSTLCRACKQASLESSGRCSSKIPAATAWSSRR